MLLIASEREAISETFLLGWFLHLGPSLRRFRMWCQVPPWRKHLFYTKSKRQKGLHYFYFVWHYLAMIKIQPKYQCFWLRAREMQFFETFLLACFLHLVPSLKRFRMWCQVPAWRNHLFCSKSKKQKGLQHLIFCVALSCNDKHSTKISFVLIVSERDAIFRNVLLGLISPPWLFLQEI